MIEALKPHVIGTQTLYHSRHPNVAERGDDSSYERAYRLTMADEATAHPERYPDLQVRVCGWNVRWNDLSAVEKQHFIATAEAQE